jgi:hypothetical protein
MLTTRIEEQLGQNEGMATGMLPTEVPVMEIPALRDQVNSIIHDGLTDMWLLLTGEELEALERRADRLDGRPMAMLFSGQVHMLTSRPFGLEMLRVLGIEML